MDQLKTFLRQCVKYRFWITVSIAMLLPMIGYFVGSGAYVDAATKRSGEITQVEKDVAKYDVSNPPNKDYKTVVDEKKEVLSKDVDSTQRKLYQRQEPLLQWPEVVESKFRTWGRKWPESVDRGQVQAAIYDYYVAYPTFVSKVYQTFKPWNPVDGTGIVLAPDEATLIKPAGFTLETTPDLGKVWAEQERLWVVTALLDVVAKVNKDAGAKDWDGAWIKQIVDIDVGSALAEDQKSLAKGVTLEAAPPIVPEGTVVPDPAAAPAGGADGMMSGMMSAGGGAKTGEVYALKADTPVPYKVLPIQITVMIDQSRLAEFMVALENSPMSIQVMEPEISKPTMAIIKPIVGESNYASGSGMMGSGMGMGMAGEGMMSSAMMRSGMGRQMSGPGGAGNETSGMMSSAMMRGGMGGGAAPAAPKRTGTDIRSEDRGKTRKDKASKEAARIKAAPPKKGVDQYFNVIQLTIYGQAHFYNTPAPVPAVEPSTAPAATTEATPVPATSPAAPNEPGAPATPPAPPTTLDAAPGSAPIPPAVPGAVPTLSPAEPSSSAPKS